VGFGGPGGGFQRLHELQPTVVARRAGVEYGEPVQAQERPGHAGRCQGESVAPVVLRLRHTPGQSAAVLIGQAGGTRVADGYPRRAGHVQADCVDKGVGVAGGLEVDQTGIGGT
jgi:hypothetical protein